jgi:hypothetical protein
MIPMGRYFAFTNRGISYPWGTSSGVVGSVLGADGGAGTHYRGSR